MISYRVKKRSNFLPNQLWVNGESMDYNGKIAFSIPTLTRHGIDKTYLK